MLILASCKELASVGGRQGYYLLNLVSQTILNFMLLMKRHEYSYDVMSIPHQALRGSLSPASQSGRADSDFLSLSLDDGGVLGLSQAVQAGLEGLHLKLKLSPSMHGQKMTVSPTRHVTSTHTSSYN